jgi:ribonuclease HI
MDFFKNLNNSDQVVAYTDGACSGNPGPGGWGVVLQCGDNSHDLYGGELATTNNRMELTACIQAFKAIPQDIKITIRTDSKYLKDGMVSWIAGWKKKGWKTAGGTPVKNIDLWQELDALAAARVINWEWVAAHSGEPGNERADMLAKQGIVSARVKNS